MSKPSVLVTGVKRDILRRSSIGAMVTAARSASAPPTSGRRRRRKRDFGDG